MIDLHAHLCRLSEPPSDLPGYQWVSQNVELSADSELKNFEFSLFPLARFVLDQLCHNIHLRRFTEMVSAQVGKTVTILAYLCWKIVNQPSGVAWYTATGLVAKDDWRSKIKTMLESCAQVAALLPTERTKANNVFVDFGFMILRILGAEASANRKGKTIAEVLCDEVQEYKPGAMQQIDNRFKTITNWRRIIFSSAGDITQEPYPSFQRGSRHMGFWKCPKCRHQQTFRFGREASPLYPEPRQHGGFVWETNAKTKPGENVYHFAELVKTIRYQCENPKCLHEFRESEKLSLIRSVEFLATNPMHDPTDISVHCWEAYMPFSGCSWSSIVTRFLQAVVAMKQGNIQPMKIFRTETEGEPWEERGEKPPEGELLNRRGDFSVGEEWPSEIKCARQITADMQLGFIKLNYSIFRPDGAKRTVDVRKVLGFDELRSYQLEKKVQDAGVGIDCAKWTKDVLRACVRYGRWMLIHGKLPRNPARCVKVQGGWKEWTGWVPLLGDDAEEFSLSVDNTTIKTFTKGVAVDSNIGRSGLAREIIRVSWSNPHYHEELILRRIVGIGPLFEIPQNISPEYITQMQARERHPIRDAEGKIAGYEWRERGRHDDCDNEGMQLVLADVNGITKE